ncbi:MAG: hypothetical protein AAGC44_10660 [Planctomycetota bacterium]
MIVLVLLGISLFLAILVFRMGYRDGDWHWGAALAVALIPVAFTLFLGIIGFIVAIGFTVAIWKATSI